MNSYIDNPDKGAHDSAQWARKWTTEKYIANRRANFETVDAYLNQPIGKLLDIGCGFAWDSRWFGEKYGTELWLLDGDQSPWYPSMKLYRQGPERRWEPSIKQVAWDLEKKLLK